MDKIARLISDKMVRKKMISDEDKMFYSYALECFFICFLNIVTIFGIAICMNKFLECCFFLIVFCPLRSLCGGVHMKKWYSCYVVSCGIVAMILWMSGWIVVGYPVLIAELILGNIVILKLAPCVHENHSLEQEEVMKVKKKAIGYSMLIGFVAIGLKIIGNEVLVMLCFSAVWLVVVLLVLGKILERCKGEKSI